MSMHTTHSNTQYKNESKHSEMGPERQNPIQRTVSLFICVCIGLCTIVAHNIAQNRPDSFPPYPPDNHHSHTKRKRDREAHLNYYASAYNRGRQLLHRKTKLNKQQQNTKNLNYISTTQYTADVCMYPLGKGPTYSGTIH